ncbi:MAG: carboxylate-amine ligase [Deltaproteobacteria bacterium]|nr:carboxylate-amine ligase [Deltaproteobacteria bacterium]
MYGVDLTVGVEEEYQIVCPDTRDLYSYVTQFLEQGRQVLPPDTIRPELMESQIEAGSNVCTSVAEIRSEVIRMRRLVSDLARKNGLVICSAGTHPFASWDNQSFTAGERFRRFLSDMAGVASQLLTFGLHVHIGFGHDDEAKDLLFEIGSQLRYFLPHILALSTSSPFWQGRDTGLKSYRNVILEMVPRTGIPSAFRSYSEYQALVNLLGQVGSIGLDAEGRPDATMIWWDLRFNPKYETLEVRIPDACTRVDEVGAVVALIMVVVVRLLKLYQQNQSWRAYRRHHIVENKWRAMRYGIEDRMIDFGKKALIPTRDIMLGGLAKDLENAKELGCLAEIDYVRHILDHGTSADRQLAVHRSALADGASPEEALKAVVDRLAAETVEGVYEDELSCV